MKNDWDRRVLTRPPFWQPSIPPPSIASRTEIASFGEILRNVTAAQGAAYLYPHFVGDKYSSPWIACRGRADVTSPRRLLDL